ncbi:L-aspartate oxidase [Candidatus Omnitrophus magneticus]|uniref:L-aspartate oxidase n=1 Tax=Candidatus Omnitrophus magneticus TaxID=1609969 RepID=A0A0F0CLB2_9BACT|nr:L-aspartate oxidase [Candidatus Omnitrophus magneticus]
MSKKQNISRIPLHNNFSQKIITTILILIFSVQNIIWADTGLMQSSPQNNTLQVLSGFNSMSLKIHHEFLISSYIATTIKSLGGSLENITKRMFPIVKGMQIDIRFDKKYTDESNNIIIPCSLSAQNEKWTYNAVISKDGEIKLQKQIKKSGPAKNDTNFSDIEELKNPNLSFLYGIPRENIQVKEIDYLIVGGGVAGLSCVAGLCQKDKDASIVVISKGAHGKSSTTQYAQGGAAVCLSPEDSPQLHAKDTLRVGDGFSSPQAARILAEETPIRIRELIAWGADFDKKTDGSIELGKESGSSVNRIIHYKGAQTGEEIERTLAKKVMELSKENRKNIQIDENIFIIDLLIKSGKCVGALGVNQETGKYILYRAKTTTLATGGVSRVFERNTNPKFSTGDGTALAYRAGAELANMEMIQFHPTALSVIDNEGKSFLISERVRGDGAKLMNVNSEYFMEKYHPKKEMAPRNVVARAVFWEMQKTKSDFVYLDISPIKNFKTKFPQLYEECKTRGIDLDKSPLIPVSPASHFTIGGVLTDMNGKTTVEGLYAIGEVAYTGLHGADRMASNSLDEGLVFGRRASYSMINHAQNISNKQLKYGDLAEKMPTITANDKQESNKIFNDIDSELGRIMQDRVCLIRNKQNLETALLDVKKLREKFFKIPQVPLKNLELRNKLENAELIIVSALTREESRGAHFRDDYQQKDVSKWQIISKKGLITQDLKIKNNDVAWLFKLPEENNFFFGIDEKIANNQEIYNKILNNEEVFFEIPINLIGDNTAIIINLLEALTKKGYTAKDASTNLNTGEFFISIINTKANKTALKLSIKILLNSSGFQDIDDISGPSHRFPLWIRSILKNKLPGIIGKDETEFLLKNKGAGFIGIINDVPENLRYSLKPKQYPNSIVIYEGAISAIAGIFKEILPKYYDVPLTKVEEELTQTIFYYHTVKLWIRDSGIDFKELKENIISEYKTRNSGESAFKTLIRGIRRQYGYKIKSENILLRELVIQFITEAVRFNKEPQIINDKGEEININSKTACSILNFIISHGLVPESSNREKEITTISALVEGKQIKEKTRKKIEELFRHLDKTYTSPENEKSFYTRVKIAATKAEAIEQGKRISFQDEEKFRAKNRQALSQDSFKKLATIYEQANTKYQGLIYAVLGFMDAGKIDEFRNDQKYAELNFANHPETGYQILKDKKIFQELGLSDSNEELALAIVRQHGFIGQAKRGEVTDEVFKPILNLAIERKDPDILKLYFIINVIDTSIVSEGLFMEEFFNWFFNKYIQLEELSKKGIKENKNADEILLEEEQKLLSNKTAISDYALERLARIRPESGIKNIKEAVERVFTGLPEEKQKFFNLLARQKNSFSFWYPETALSWLQSIDSEIKYIYLLLLIAELKCNQTDMPIDINLYTIANEVMRRDELRLNLENCAHIENVLSKLNINELTDPSEIEQIFDYGLSGLIFEFDKKNNAVYGGFDTFAPIELSSTRATIRIEELSGIIDNVTPDNPIRFIKKQDIKNPKKIGIYSISGDPIQRSHKAIIEKAIKEYNLDELILVMTKGHIIKEKFGATLAQRIFMIEQDIKDFKKVSIAVSESGRFIKMSQAVKIFYPQENLYLIMGFDNFEQMLDTNKSGNTLQDLKTFFNSTHVLVTPRGYRTNKDIENILIEQNMTEFKDSVSPLLAISPENRFDSSTEARRRIRDNVPENTLLSSTIMRIINALGLYRKIYTSKEKIQSLKDSPTKIVLVNIASPRHRVISEPLGMNAMMGDLRKTFGKEVIVSSIDTQFGMCPEDALKELIKKEPDIIGLSAQLESNKYLYELLKIINNEQSFKTKKVIIVVGHNLPTNDNKNILTKYPFVITIRGEGELAGRELVKYSRGEISLSDIPAASYVRNGKIIENDGFPITVANLGLPARDNIAEILNHGGDIAIETSRGCGWGHCSFCFKDPFRAHRWEPYPDNVVIEGLAYLYKMSVRHVSLSDSEFLGAGKETQRGISRAKRLAEEIIKRGIHLKIAFSCRADSVYKKSDTEEIRKEKLETFKLLKKAGFINIFLGLESGSQKQLIKDYTKGITVEENETAIKLLREMGFDILAGFIPLDPYSTLQTLQANINFVRKNNLYLEISFPLNQMKIQPNTRYYTRVLSDGLLKKQKDVLHMYDCRYQDQNVQKIADILDKYVPEVGSVFYVLKYMYRTESLNLLPEENAEREILKQFFIEYNKMEVDFLDALVNSVRDEKKFKNTIYEFRKQRLNLVLKVEEKIKDGTIKDQNNTLKTEIEKIRPILNALTAGKLDNVSADILTEETNLVTKINELLKEGYPQSVETLKKLDSYAELMKKNGHLAEFTDIPIAKAGRRLELLIELSDDLKTTTLYKVLDDSGIHSANGGIDYSKLKLEFIASFPSNNLIFPDNYIAKHFSGPTLSKIFTLFTRGGKYTKYDGIITNADNRVDLDVWSTNIDTVYIHKVLKENDIFTKNDIKIAAEIGVGGGHLSSTLVQNLKNLKEFVITDISIYALMAAKRNILPFAQERGVNLRTFLGKGIKNLDKNLDLIVINPPYIPFPSWEKTAGSLIEDPYKGTGLMREIIKEGINHLNPDNPNASIIMNYSSLADDDFKEYLRAYGKLVDVESISPGLEVPLKIEQIDNRWLSWMEGKGLIVKKDVPADGFKYWHTLRVVRITPKKVSLSHKDGRIETIVLNTLKLKSKDSKQWNNLTLSSKLMILTLLQFNPKDYSWFDNEWRELYQIIEYYKTNIGQLKTIIEKHLNQNISVDASDLLQTFYSTADGFFGANIIKEIYFNGKNPHVSPDVIRTLRNFVNTAPSMIKETLLRVFTENIKHLSWDKGITEYLKQQYGYTGSFTITDITDFSIGTGVYKVTLSLNSAREKLDIEIFLKREHSVHRDLRNEIAYLNCEKLFLKDAMLDRLPFYYSNELPGKPDLLIAPVLNGQSLDSELSSLKLSNSKNKWQINTESESISQEKKYIFKIVMALAKHAALGDILGRNDRNLANTRILSNAARNIESIIDFDISNMLDNAEKGEKPWYLNYDWILEDIKQGLSEVTLLALLKEYKKNTINKNLSQRLKTRSEIIEVWKKEYLKTWEEITLPENMKKIKDIIKKVYKGTPAVISKKIAVLEKFTKIDPNKFLKQIFSAFLFDYEKRQLYLDSLSRVKEKAGIAATGYLNKYIPVSADSSLSNKTVIFRGILSENFLKRHEITRRKSIEEIFKDIENIVSVYLGENAKENLKKEVLRARKEADYILTKHFSNVFLDEPRLTDISNENAPIIRNLSQPKELAQGMVEMFYSFGLSGKKLVIAFSENIKSKEAVRVIETLNKIKESKRTDAKLKNILNNIIVLSNVNSESDLIIKMNSQGVNMDEKDANGGAKNILALFVPKLEQKTFASLCEKENVFSSYIDEGKEEYNIEYYPLPEIVTITLSNILDKLAGIDRLIKQEDVITKIQLENGIIQLSDINIEMIKREGSRNLIFILIPNATRYNFRKDKYLLAEELIKISA